MDAPDTAKSTPAAEPVGDFARLQDNASASPSESVKDRSTTEKPQRPETSFDQPPFVAGVKPEADRASAAAASANQKSPSGLSYLAAGIAGGVVALGGFLVLQWGNVLPVPGTRPVGAELQRLEQKIADLQRAPVSVSLDEASRAQLEQMQKNVQAAEIKAEAVAGTLSQLQQRLDALPKTQAQDYSAEIKVLHDKIAALESAVSDTRDQAKQASAAATNTSGTISTLQSMLNALQEKVSSAARQPDATLLVAANALKTAIDRGGSFKSELETYASLAPEDDAVNGLRPFADKGIATLAELNAWFGPVANKMVASENRLPDDAGVWDHLKASAMGLVSVRPVAGNVEGSGVGPTTARMEDALQKGDLQRAYSEWETLPADAKAVSSEFISQLKARRDADALIQRLVADSVKPKQVNEESTLSTAPAGN